MASAAASDKPKKQRRTIWNSQIGNRSASSPGEEPPRTRKYLMVAFRDIRTSDVTATATAHMSAVAYSSLSNTPGRQRVITGRSSSSAASFRRALVALRLSVAESSSLPEPLKLRISLGGCKLKTLSSSDSVCELCGRLPAPTRPMIAICPHCETINTAPPPPAPPDSAADADPPPTDAPTVAETVETTTAATVVATVVETTDAARFMSSFENESTARRFVEFVLFRGGSELRVALTVLFPRGPTPRNDPLTTETKPEHSGPAGTKEKLRTDAVW
mmetsp:Transcript_28200/g.56929  ORF Transcript_28200/g.56929 Transcript_28200/m.56929 type:complete len:275 (+) Transcript_28200:1549-2373(+)